MRGPDRTFVRVNDRLLSWLGRTRDEIVGKTKPTDFMTAEALRGAKDSFAVLMRHAEVKDLHGELLPVDGKVRHVSVSATAMTASKP